MVIEVYVHVNLVASSICSIPLALNIEAAVDTNISDIEWSKVGGMLNGLLF